MKIDFTNDMIINLAEIYIYQETGIEVKLKKEDIKGIYKIEYKDKEDKYNYDETYVLIGNRFFTLPKYIEFNPNYDKSIEDLAKNNSNDRYEYKITNILKK